MQETNNCPKCGAKLHKMIITTDPPMKYCECLFCGWSDDGVVYGNVIKKPTNTEWISVNDRLPSLGERVIATDGVFVGEAFVTTSGLWLRYNATSWEYLLKSKVTHWMPMPDAKRGG